VALSGVTVAVLLVFRLVDAQRFGYNTVRRREENCPRCLYKTHVFGNDDHIGRALLIQGLLIGHLYAGFENHPTFEAVIILAQHPFCPVAQRKPVSDVAPMAECHEATSGPTTDSNVGSTDGVGSTDDRAGYNFGPYTFATSKPTMVQRYQAIGVPKCVKPEILPLVSQCWVTAHDDVGPNTDSNVEQRMNEAGPTFVN